MTAQQIATQRGYGQPILTGEGYYQPVLVEMHLPFVDVSTQLIDFHGGAQSVGGTSRNMINGISEWNPIRGEYIRYSIAEFGELPNNGPNR
jgi:hypothetical protein